MDFSDFVRAHCKQYKYSAEYERYWLAHPYCEVGVAESSHVRYASPPHHIRTRGAGGDDRAENLLALCTDCHTEVHQIGTGTFAQRHRSAKAKIRRARMIARMKHTPIAKVEEGA